LGWLGEVLEEFRRVLAPNGSLYLFASPKMAARVELKVGEYFEILNRITWAKPPFSTKAEMFRKEDMRSYFPTSEAVIFAEHFGADSQAKGESGYGAKCDELRGFVFEPLRAYFEAEKIRSGASNKQVNEFLGVAMNGSGMAGHYFKRSGTVQWELPTRENYHLLRKALNSIGNGDYLPRCYEDLRREYEDLRRPFTVSSEVPYTDVWNYPTVQNYPGKHPTEKPYQMHIDVINASSRPGDTVLDPFGGSCKVYDACMELGRVPIIIEKDEGYYRAAMKRIRNKPITLEKAMAAAERPPATLEKRISPGSRDRSIPGPVGTG